MASDWLDKLGKAGFQMLLRDVVDKAIDAKVEPRLKAIEAQFKAIETRFAAVEGELRSIGIGQKALENRIAAVDTRVTTVQMNIGTLSSIEERLSIADRLSKVEAAVARLEGHG